MDLWIRTQDKHKIIKVSEAYIVQCGIYAPSSYGNCLGEYKSDERALEVLDEIQKLLSHGEILVFNNFQPYDYEMRMEILKSLEEKPILFTQGNEKADYISRDCIVYEMPEE